MKQFIEHALATLVGLFLFFIASIFLFLGLMGALAASSTETQTVLKPNSVYVIELEGVLQDRGSADDALTTALTKAVKKNDVPTVGLNDLLKNIERAAQEPEIKGIYLKGGELAASYASITELRNALLRFKESGKWIVAYADSYTQSNYYLASVADKIMVNQEGMLSWAGLYSETVFTKEFYDKIGVEMQVVKVGTFKSAVEPYLLTEMSEANRLQMKKMLTDIWTELLKNVSTSRELSVEQLQTCADRNMVYCPAVDYVTNGLVDTLLYEQDVDAVMEELLNVDAVQFVSHSEMKLLPAKNIKAKEPKVAVIYAEGSITDKSGKGIVGEDMVKTIREIQKDSTIKTVVLRVNSPGGSAFASEQIWYAFSQLKKDKPIVVSMGDYAASGGYYISCMADAIVAQPTTLTGSIGIFGIIPNLNGLMDKVGVNIDGVGTNARSGMELEMVVKGMDEETRAILQAYVNRGYELFVNRCAEGRAMTADAIKQIAEGRVWSGVAALENGLVDTLGGLNDAISIAAQKAALESYRVVEYPKQKDAFTQLMEELGGMPLSKALNNKQTMLYYLLNRVEELKQEPYALEAVMPMEIKLR